MSEVVELACEDRGHFCMATRHVDDALVSSHAWLDGILADCRSWCGLKQGNGALLKPEVQRPARKYPPHYELAQGRARRIGSPLPDLVWTEKWTTVAIC